MRRESAGHRERPQEGFGAFHAHRVLGVEASDGAFHEQRSQQSGCTMTRLKVSHDTSKRGGTHPSQEDELRAVLLLLVFGDEVVGVCVSKVEAGAGAPVA